MSPIAELPTTRNDVPCRAVRTRNIKYAARLGDKAVAVVESQNSSPLTINICRELQSDIELTALQRLLRAHLQDDDPIPG